MEGDMIFKVLLAGVMLAMVVGLWPHARHMLKNSPKGTASDWMGYLIPLAAVIGFVFLLVLSLR